MHELHGPGGIMQLREIDPLPLHRCGEAVTFVKCEYTNENVHLPSNLQNCLPPLRSEFRSGGSKSWGFSGIDDLISAAEEPSRF